MCGRLGFAALVSALCLISTAGADVVWDFADGNDCHFELWSYWVAAPGPDDPNVAGDESLTGIGQFNGLPDGGLAWSLGTPNQYDGLKPAVEKGARVNANGLLDYSLGVEYIPRESGTLNTFNLNQNGDWLHIADNDQGATSPMMTLGEGAMLKVLACGGSAGTIAPAYDANPDLFYADGSLGVAVLSAESEDKWALLASLAIQGKGTMTEHTLDLSALAGRSVRLEVVDAAEGEWGWLAIDKIEVTNTTLKMAAFIVQMHDGVLDGGFDQVQVDHLNELGYDVSIVDYTVVQGGTFDGNEFDVVVISETPNSNACNNLIGTSVPIMHQEAFGWDNFYYMGVRTDIRWADGNEVEIVNDTHPIIVDANVPLGPMTFYDPPCSWTTELVSMMAPGAELLAKITIEGSDYAIVMALEKGAELANGKVTLNRAVCFSLPGLFPDNGGPFKADRMTPAAWALYDASIAWLASSPDAKPEPGPDAGRN